MLDKYLSERLLNEIPRPVINFIWYLWDVYHSPCETEFQVLLRVEEGLNQQFIIYSVGISISQDFNYSINTDIAIRKEGLRIIMEHY